jgi:hypothetical protein
MVVPGGQGVFVPMSKILGRGFSIRSTGHAGVSIFGQRAIDDHG